MVALGKRLAAIESQTERRNVRAESVIRFDRFRNKIRPLAFFTWVFVLAKVRIWPAVERPLPHAREIIGYEIVA